jgi:hypothetical protein
MNVNDRPHKGARRAGKHPDVERLRGSAKGKRHHPTKAAMKRLAAKLDGLRSAGSVKGKRVRKAAVSA